MTETVKIEKYILGNEVTIATDTVSCEYVDEAGNSMSPEDREAFYTGDEYRAEAIEGEISVRPEDVCRNMGELLESSEEFFKTGNIHIAGLALANLSYTAEDISRSSAIKKVIGKCILNKDTPGHYVLYTSGRVSEGIIRLCINAGIGTIVSKSAVTNRALGLALEKGITVYGFVSKSKANKYLSL